MVPGIGTIHGFCANNQASATWAGVALFRAAMLPRRSTIAWFARSTSGAKRGSLLRESLLSKAVSSVIFPVRGPPFGNPPLRDINQLRKMAVGEV